MAKDALLLLHALMPNHFWSLAGLAAGVLPGSRRLDGRAEAAEAAFRAHYARIYRYLLRKTHNRDQAEDLAQDVFAAAAKSLAEREPGAPVLAWLYTVAQRRFADALREKERMPPLKPLEQVEDREAFGDGYGPAVTRALAVSIARLPDTQRRVVVAKLIEGRSFAEIAAGVDSTEAACKMRFMRGLQAVRSDLRESGISP